MAEPKGSLTAAQYEIMAAIWDADDEGMTIADIWQKIGQVRDIGRTTVLNQVDRLEKRGWLRRLAGEGPTRFCPTLSKKDASRLLVADFVTDYFRGSPADLMSALLGSDAGMLTRKEIDRLRKLLDQARRNPEEGRK